MEDLMNSNNLLVKNTKQEMNMIRLLETQKVHLLKYLNLLKLCFMFSKRKELLY